MEGFLKLPLTFRVRMNLLQQLCNELRVCRCMVLSAGNEAVYPVRRSEWQQLRELRPLRLVKLRCHLQRDCERLRQVFDPLAHIRHFAFV